MKRTKRGWRIRFASSMKTSRSVSRPLMKQRRS